MTPLMKQYNEIKQQYSDVIVLFQVGDFYELFFEDAKTASNFLGITLTKRGTHNGEPIPLCGVPLHARDHYVAKLVRGGFKVALCHQLEQPKPGTVVKRGVTEVFTPGMLTDSSLLDEKKASYILSLYPDKHGWGLVFAEILTSQILATSVSVADVKSLESELARFLPDEIIVPSTPEGKACGKYVQQLGYFVSTVDYQQSPEYESWKQERLSDSVDPEVAKSLQSLYAYIQSNQPGLLDQCQKVHCYSADDYVIMDSSTVSNLELIYNQHDRTSKHTLFSVMDTSATPMGSRLLKKWLVRPAINRDVIERRYEVIERLLSDVSILDTLKTILKSIGDVERIVGRIALSRAQRNDYVMLQYALHQLPNLKSVLYAVCDASLCAKMYDGLDTFDDLRQLLDSALHNDIESPWLIKPGYSQQLDSLRQLVDNSAQLIVDLERSEQEKTGIGSLKIRYNNVHGYYIEVTKTHYDSVPDHYIRTQTLAGKERYMTPELRELQTNIINAREQVNVVEKQLYQELQHDVFQYVARLRSCAKIVAHVDLFYGLARCAYHNSYVKPTLTDDRDVKIVKGRHPVVETIVSDRFITNDTTISDDASTLIITGPNMGGKSTYLRQVALISIMAQCGSYVPADSVTLPIFDRIFTRIGAGDNLAEGKSTFLVEMEETAYICKNATNRSLVILDEVGRGTSTYDGLSIAQAVVEYITQTLQSRCLFATHYHELTLLQKSINGIACYHATSKRADSGILLLHTIVPGVSEGSFGLEVAKYAQLPDPVVGRAQAIMGSFTPAHTASIAPPPVVSDELNQLKKQLLKAQNKLKTIESLDLNSMTPKQVFDLVWNLSNFQQSEIDN